MASIQTVTVNVSRAAPAQYKPRRQSPWANHMVDAAKSKTISVIGKIRGIIKNFGSLNITRPLYNTCVYA